MNFREYLIKKGFKKEVADSICLKVENEMPLTEEQKKFYDDWWNKELMDTLIF